MPFLKLNGQGRPPIRLEQIGRRRFRLLTGFRYRDPTPGVDPETPVPSRDESDLASIPFPLWGLIGPYGMQTLPALLHDHLCDQARNTAQTQGRSEAFAQRREADRVFRVALREEGVPLLRRWIMWAGAYKDFAPLLFVLLCLQLLIAVSLIYSVVLSLGRWKVPAPPPVARLWKQVIHLPLMESAWLSSLEGWKLAVLLLAMPAVAALLWLRAFRVPLIGSYIGALVLPPGVLMFIVAVVLWIPDFVEFAIKRARGWTVGLPGPVPWRLRRTFP
jgi:hypothetical protein